MTQGIFSLTPSILSIFERFLILALSVAIVLWAYSAIRCRFAIIRKKPFQITVRIALIEGALLSIFMLAIYFAIFVKYTGWQRFVWDEWYWSFSRNTYLMLLPEILTLGLLSIFFFVQTNKLSYLLKSK